MQYTHHPVTLECCHCGAHTCWPIWARVEHLRYQALCWLCFRRLDRAFTATAAISQAALIVRSARSAVCDGC